MSADAPTAPARRAATARESWVEEDPCRTRDLPWGIAGVDQAYTLQERQRAIAWKNSSASVPDEARVPAQYVNKDGSADGMPYDFCLPVDFAHLSLLPEVREPALALFSELGIPWHAGVGDGPSNHLLSSQVQFVNALGQMVADRRTLGPPAPSSHRWQRRR